MNEILTDVILNSFINSTLNGFVPHYLGDVTREFYTFSSDEEYGVMMSTECGKDCIDETFSEIRFYTRSLDVSGKSIHCIVLSCSDMHYARKFATICADFVNSEDKIQRKKVQADPLSWWIEWTRLVGNILLLEDTYSIIGEMMTVCYLFENGFNPQWEGIGGAVRDIVCDDRSVEVKSTLCRYSYNVEIAGEFQLDCSEKISLFFCRFERSESGVCIDEMVDKLVSIGYSCREEIEKLLTSAGVPRGRSIRRIRYSLIQMLEYPVDDNFPCITPKSFSGGIIPHGISHIRYTVDLEAVSGSIVIDYPGHQVL